MINPNELRIGNWVMYRDDNSNPEFVHNAITVEDLDIIYYNKRNHYYEPIPLTPERLLKCGFETMPHYTVTGTMNIKIGRGRVISISCCGTPNEMVFLSEEEPPLVKNLIVLRNYDYDGKTFLHQLQNLYYCLTGQELENFKL